MRASIDAPGPSTFDEQGLADPPDEGGHVAASASLVLERAAQEIDHLWRASMTGDRMLTGRLVEVSHSLHRAARRLEGDDGIG